MNQNNATLGLPLKSYDINIFAESQIMWKEKQFYNNQIEQVIFMIPTILNLDMQHLK